MGRGRRRPRADGAAGSRGSGPAGSLARGSTSPRTCCAMTTTATRSSSGTSGGRQRAAHLSRAPRARWRPPRRAFAGLGVGPGDRVAGFLPNMPETVVAMLATASLGAIWSSCSPDFGANGVLDRFGQIRPRVLVLRRWLPLRRQGDRLARAGARSVRQAMPAIERVVVVPYLGSRPDRRGLPGALPLGRAARTRTAVPTARLRAPAVRPSALHHVLVGHDRPSEVHGARGGRNAAAASEGARAAHRPRSRRPALLLHHLRLDDVELAGLEPRGRGDGGALRRRPARAASDPLGHGAAGAADGVRHEREVSRAGGEGGARARRRRTISPRCVPFSPPAARSPAHSYDYVYRAIKQDVHLASISGGTDISPASRSAIRSGRSGAASCRPAGSGWRSTSSTSAGRPVRDGEGELVCTRPFPSMPIAFWNDPDGAKYRAAYFDRFPGRLASRRLGPAHRARRTGDSGPQRRDAQPGRRADRHGGDLSPGRAAARGGGESRGGTGLAGRRADRAVRPAARGL